MRILVAECEESVLAGGFGFAAPSHRRGANDPVANARLSDATIAVDASDGQRDARALQRARSFAFATISNCISA